LYTFLYPVGVASTVVTTSEVRAALSQITKRFDEGDTEPVFFGSHRRAQAVLVPIATWGKLLEHAEDALDTELVQQRLTDHRPWLSEDEVDAALGAARSAAEGKPA
jgi:antitoxin StbD